MEKSEQRSVQRKRRKSVKSPKTKTTTTTTTVPPIATTAVSAVSAGTVTAAAAAAATVAFVPGATTSPSATNDSYSMGNVMGYNRTDTDFMKLIKPKLACGKRLTTTTSAIWKATSKTLQKSITNSRTNMRTDQHSATATAAAAISAALAGASTSRPASILHHQQQKKPNLQRYFDPIRNLRETIPEINDMFDLHQLIGYGAFSVVLLATLKRENKSHFDKRAKFAIKHLAPNNSPKRIKREMAFLTKIGGSDNVVKLSCSIRSDEAVAFVMPYLQCEHFKYYFRLMDPAEVQLYMQNLLLALRHVHKFNVIHRDIKPGNFLYNRIKRKFLLVDFGLAEEMPDPNSNAQILEEVERNEPRRASRAGTRGFRPPEVLLRYVNQTTAVDMWAAGVIFLSILTKMYPVFKPPNDQIAIKEIITVFGDKHICKVAKKLKCSLPVSESIRPLDLRKICLHFRNLCKNPILKSPFVNPAGTDNAIGKCTNCKQFHFNCLCLHSKANSNMPDMHMGDCSDPYPASAYDLLYKLMQVNPLERITAEDALKHNFFKEHLLKMGHSTTGNFDMPIRGGLLQALTMKQN